MKKIGIIDADLLGRDKHRFPNLVSEKISAYHKNYGDETKLLLDYDHFDEYDEIYISKVFTDTPIPEWLSNKINLETCEADLPKKIHVGGTGFYFDKAPNLPEEIEHINPDYHLYDEWILGEVEKARENKDFNEDKFMVQFKEYTDYSIGFLTRGCFRKCGFCVNKKYDHVFKHSPLLEFYEPSRKKICLLDDNFLGCSKWKEMLEELIATGKPFKFKQGLDERLLTDEKCKLLFNAKYDGDFTFAFDNVSDYDLIHEKLKLIFKYKGKRNVKFYVLVGFEGIDEKDIENAFIRIELLLRYGCLPYIMRYQNKNDIPYKNSKYKTIYVTLARWCNQVSMIKKKSFREFCELNQKISGDKNKNCTVLQAMLDFEKDFPEITKKYFDVKMRSNGEIREELGNDLFVENQYKQSKNKSLFDLV